MKRVLVTGASGCIGRHVVPVLARHGWDVHAVSSGPQPATHGVTWHTADLLDDAAITRVVRGAAASHLLHLAWSVRPGKWATAPENFLWAEATLALAREFKEAGGQRFVGAGSCLEYDWRFGYCSEQLTPTRPHTAYGISKHATQLLLSGYAQTSGLSCAWGRAFFLYGPHEHPDRLVAAVARALVGGEPARCSHGRQVRDYLYVQDVADAFGALLESAVEGPINIASGEAVSLRTIVERLGALTGRADLLRLGAIPAAATDTPLVVADMTHAFRELAWRPRISLDEGLDRTVAFWRARVDQAQLEAKSFL
jgi:nucleoside-diphosphate-sugar epimerase